MDRLEIPFTGSEKKGEITFLNGEECINYYPDVISTPEGNKLILRATQGLILKRDLGVSSGIRGMVAVKSNLYVVCNDTFYVLDSAYSTVYSSTVMKTTTGVVSMACNGNDVTFVDGPYGYVYDLGSETVAQITDADFPGGDTITYIDGFYVVNRPGTGQFYKSALGDGTSWSALDFSSAGRRPDDLLNVYSFIGNLLLFGEETTEIWYNAGTSDFPLQRRTGSMMEIGTIASHSVADIDNAVYWLGRDDNGQCQVFRAVGFSPEIISTTGITERLQNWTEPSQAVGFTYQIDNHAFYEICSTVDDESFVYDSSLGLWHVRESRLTNDAGRKRYGRHRINNHVLFLGKHICGDFETGKIYEMKRGVFTENGEEHRSKRRTAPFNSNQDLLSVFELTLLMKPGVGRVTGTTDQTAPKINLRYSYDGGITWSDWYIEDLAPAGDYVSDVGFWQLGQGKNWVFEVYVTSPVERDLYGGFVEAKIDN